MSVFMYNGCMYWNQNICPSLEVKEDCQVLSSRWYCGKPRVVGVGLGSTYDLFILFVCVCACVK